MNKRTILVADHLFEKKNFFEYKKSKLRFNIVFNSSLKPINDQFLIKYFKNNQRIVGVVAGLEKYNKFTLAYQKNLKVISRVGVGVDSLDLNFLKKKKIKVLRLTNELTNSVAELNLSLILCLSRKVLDNYILLKNKIWEPIISDNLKDRKIGILGFGKIGKKTYKLLKNFKSKIYIFEKKFLNTKYIKTSLKTIFKKCDIVCICLSLNQSTKYIINKNIFKKTNKRIMIVNTARGALINEKDLYLFLKKNKKASAFVDCFENEPYTGKLLGLKNLFFLPHVASYTKQARKDMEYSASKKLVQYLDKIEKD